MIRSIRITMYEVCSQEPSIVSNTHHNISETVNFLLNLEASEFAKMYFFYLTFKLLTELIKYFIFHYQAQVTQAWLMNHDCCLQSSVWRQVLLFNINQSLLGWGRWCEYKCVVMIPDNEMILAAARLKQRREIEIINMNEPYLCLMHAREILLLIVLTIHNELTYLFLQS